MPPPVVSSRMWSGETVSLISMRRSASFAPSSVPARTERSATTSTASAVAACGFPMRPLVLWISKRAALRELVRLLPLVVGFRVERELEPAAAEAGPGTPRRTPNQARFAEASGCHQGSPRGSYGTALASRVRPPHGWRIRHESSGSVHSFSACWHCSWSRCSDSSRKSAGRWSSGRRPGPSRAGNSRPRRPASRAASTSSKRRPRCFHCHTEHELTDPEHPDGGGQERRGLALPIPELGDVDRAQHHARSRDRHRQLDRRRDRARDSGRRGQGRPRAVSGHAVHGFREASTDEDSRPSSSTCGRSRRSRTRCA